LYAASTLYHSATDPVRRARLRIFDHAAIYVLIAGTYTPFTLLVLPSPIGTILLAAVWLMAVAGIIIKLFFTGRFKLFSTLMYVSMGWLIVFAFNPLLESMEPHGLQWLLAGGIAYTVGAVLYSIKKLPFNHAIFHVFVLAGTFCHFIAVYQYCLP
jgi:hemolysin III